MKLYFLLTVFISSFLLFVIQPLFAKIILPNFGGGSSVWTGCMLFFQSFLLFGYTYSYFVSRLKTIKQQVFVHSTVVSIGLLVALFIALSNVWFGVLPEASSNTASSLLNSDSSPFLQIFYVLSSQIGIPYFILSSTAPLMQHWLSLSEFKSSTYRLYSVSNIGALLALFSYPFLIETTFTLNAQYLSWLSLFIVFVFLVSSCLFYVLRPIPKASIDREPVNHVSNGKSSNTLKANSLIPNTLISNNEIVVAEISWFKALCWFLLSATGVVMLISTTSNMTQNIPPIPFLWILPLAVYLLTYILCFHDERIDVSQSATNYWALLFGITSFIGLLLFFIGTHFSAITQISLYLITLFVACMVCHGELVRHKPETKHLTFFYLILAAGGCTGSLFSSLIATQIFTQYYEYIVALGLVYLLLVLLNVYPTVEPSDKTEKPLKSKLSDSLNKQQHNVKFALILGVTGCLFLGLFSTMNTSFGQFDLLKVRNFYGTLAVKELGSERRLVDGYTAHGAQKIQVGDQVDLTPLGYYRPNSGIGQTLLSDLFPEGKRVALIGLGVGALAYYGNESDTFIFYELNPQVIEVANSHFDYLATSKAHIKLKQGDARINLHKELTSSTQGFNVIIVDAFSSDSIPTHLVTKEAMDLYKSHLSNDGLIAFHISNSYLDLKPIMRQASEQLDMTAVYFLTQASGVNISSDHSQTSQSSSDSHSTEWVIFTNNETYLQQNAIKLNGSNILMQSGQKVLWTDDYSSLLPILK